MNRCDRVRAAPSPVHDELETASGAVARATPIDAGEGAPGSPAARDLIDGPWPAVHDTCLNAEALEIRPIGSLAELSACEALQERVWGAGDFVRVSSLVLVTARSSGGIVLGAFGDDGHLAGFTCSFPGLTEEGGVKQSSLLLAVDPELRHRGIGYALKLAQRKVAFSQGLDLITWTFDPLSSLNAHFNLTKLGCTARRYVEDCYGTPEGGLNQGLSTDRLIAEWWIRRPSVAVRLDGFSLPERCRGRLVNEVETLPGTGLVRNRAKDLDLSDPELEIEIPGDVGAIKRQDLGLAKEWRSELRQMLVRYLSRGYRVVGFHRMADQGSLRGFYRLSEGTAE